LVGTVGICLVVIITSLVGYSSITTHNDAVDAAKRSALEVAGDCSGHIEVEINVAIDAARTLAQVLSLVKDSESPLAIGRDQANNMLKTVLNENEAFFGTYTLWEPDAFDQKDAAHVNLEGHDQTGRFIPYWTKSAEGLVLEPLLDYGSGGTGDYYQIPKRTRNETIIDPYVYPVQGKEVLITSLVAPIIYDNEFYGIAGTDILLDTVQEMADETKLYNGQAEVNIIAYNGMIAAASGRPELVGKDISAIHADWQEDMEYVKKGISTLEEDEGRFAVFVPIHFGKTTTPWSVNINIPRKLIFAEAKKRALISVVSGTVLIIISLLLTYFIVGRLVHPLQRLTNVASNVARGNLEYEKIETANDEVGELSSTFDVMLTSLKEEKHANETKDWLKTGIGQLNDKIRGEQQTIELAQNVVAEIVKYLGAQVGVIYLAEHGDILKLVGSYAFTSRKGISNEFKFGEGLVGQAALEKKSIIVTDVPDDYLSIASGTGHGTAKNIMVVPLMYEGNVMGAIEFGSFYEFSETQLEFLESCVDNIAIAINSANSRTQLTELLQRTQAQSEELQTQQETLRATNEELEEQTQQLKSSEEQLRSQQGELEISNVQLEEKTAKLEEQKQDLEKSWHQIQAKSQELEAANKYKSEFLSNMSHELRTPLNSLLILAKLLTDNSDGNLTDEQVESSKMIYEGGQELLSLINEILDLAKVEAGKMEFKFEDVSLSQLAQRLETEFIPLAQEKGLEFRMEVQEDLPDCISTDKKRTKQILKNLLANAFKFTAQGRISVTISRPDEGVDLSRSQLDHNKSISIAVSDSGIGIAAAKQEMIFKAFQQADGNIDRQYGGTGLGLSISTNLATLLGGEIQLQSQDGEGSTFILFLPETTEASQTDDPHNTDLSTALQSSPSPQGTQASPENEMPCAEAQIISDDRIDITEGDKVILIIEDDARFAKILKDISHEKGFKCLVAGHGEAGLNIAVEDRPQAIILDVGLPGINGFSVIDSLKDNPVTRHIPVHFISAQDENPGATQALSMGAIGYLTKPASKEQLDGVFGHIKEFISTDIKKLLVAEDDVKTRASIVKLIGNDDVKIAAVGTGQEAYDLLKTEHFDCMVLDLGLPDMSGFDLLGQIENDADIIAKPPIVIYSGKDLSRSEAVELRKHAGSIIVKGAESPERLLDETTLFLHRIETSLPLEQQRMIRMAHEKETVLQGKKVLIVDDDMRNVFALSHALKAKEMTVIIAENGQEALDMLETHGDIDIVLMDIMMPVMDGYEAMRRIREREKYWKLPILALTAKAMKGDKQKCIEAGANDYLAKPLDLDKVLSMLRVWLYI